jgi:hypothetical protein
LGEAVGFGVGDAVGFGVGDAVGFGVGDAVGFGVALGTGVGEPWVGEGVAVGAADPGMCTGAIGVP